MASYGSRRRSTQACLAALAGYLSADDVRVAFEVAAREEGMLLDGD
ncbi:DUF982 domain-containing protein [Mesorhizobium sp. B1-1-8]|nr:DUF982 domain-containing protein [Mesorhizobium sp. B1-1-8]